jgi:SsrA-binding protein
MKIITKNKKAYFDYEIIETLEAGMKLTGQEVKSIKNGKISIKGSYVILKKQKDKEIPEVFLVGCNIPPYQPNNTSSDYDPQRSRKLLLKKLEIKRLIGKTKEKGLTVIPLKVYTRKGKIKLEIAIVKGKRKTDKREKIKKKEVDRQIRRALKR